MRSTTTSAFRKCFQALPSRVQVRAREAYRTFADDPSHPGLQFKQVHPSPIGGPAQELMSGAAAWQWFGGVPRRVVLDNLKAAIDKADRYAPVSQRVFEEYARYRGRRERERTCYRACRSLGVTNPLFQ